MASQSNPLQIVDISKSDKPTAQSILSGFTTQGFLFVDGHDFTQEEVDHFFSLSREFFQLPLNEKQKYAIDGDDCGYASFNQENLDPGSNKKGDPKEAFNFGGFDFTTGQSKTSKLPPLFSPGSENHKFVKSITRKLYKLSTQILQLLALALEIPESEGGINWFSDRHKPNHPSMSSLRLLHYPSTADLDPQQRIRAGAHTDYGSVTLLFQQRGEEGLQLYDPARDQWDGVPYVESPNQSYKKEGKAAPIVVNIADQLSLWTNQVLRSTLHRVVLPGDGDRYSIVFFFDANDDTKLIPIPSKIVKGNADKGNTFAVEEGKIITARDYMLERFQATYEKGH